MAKGALYRPSAIWVLGLILALPASVHADDISSGTSPSVCVDAMETTPDYDDLTPTEIAVDGGCMVPQVPISI